MKDLMAPDRDDFVMDFMYSDGGRRAAGWKGSAGDCGCRAVATATQRPYNEIYEELNEAAKAERPRKGRQRSGARTGITMATMRKYLEKLGWGWTPTMGIGTGCRVHMHPDELPAGRLIVRLSRHYSVVIDGTCYDTYDPSRDGTRCVYGYWSQPA